MSQIKTMMTNPVRYFDIGGDDLIANGVFNSSTAGVAQVLDDDYSLVTYNAREVIMHPTRGLTSRGNFKQFFKHTEDLISLPTYSSTISANSSTVGIFTSHKIARENSFGRAIMWSAADSGASYRDVIFYIAIRWQLVV